MSTLKFLQSWYRSQCNGEWEHSYNIRIKTLKNNGWYIYINLSQTKLENKNFQTLNIQKDNNNWLFCWKQKNAFTARCSLKNLEEVMKIFKNFIENSSDNSNNKKENAEKWILVKRYNGEGKKHFNKNKLEFINTPHMHDFKQDVVRKPNPDEIPK